MPITFQLRPEDGLVEVHLSGELFTAEMVEAIDRLVEHPGVESVTRFLSDHRALTRAGTLEQVDVVLDRLRLYAGRFRADARWAIVTALPESYGTARVLSALADLRNSIEVEVFTDLESAQEWLRLPARLPGST